MLDIPSLLVIIIQIALLLTLVAAPIAAFMYIRSRSRVQRDQVSREEMDQINSRLAEMDELQGRLMEVEERLDFAERLLGQRHDPVRVDAPSKDARNVTPV